MFRPRNPKKSNRKLYLKGWYYEQVAKKLIYKKFWDEGLRVFIIKAPYGYPFDLIAFFQNNIYFFEVRFTYKNRVFIPKRKIQKVKQLIKGYNGFNFKYYCIAFFGSKHNYKLIEISLRREKNLNIG